MFTQRARHRFIQAIFWNPLVARIVPFLIRCERMFDVIVRNYSLIGDSNGERWLLSLLDEHPVAFDVGFHDGASTEELLRARRKVRVIAFDPSRFALECYRKTLAQDTRVTFENVGLSNAPGELEFYDYKNMCNSLAPRKDMPSDVGTKYSVPITTIDNYCHINEITHINFLKIDAEGFDLHVLEGAYEILSKQEIDIFMFEFASGWASSRRYLWEACQYFEPLPYTLFHLFNGFLCPLVYNYKIDSCCTLSAMYVGVSERRLARGDIPLRQFVF